MPRPLRIGILGATGSVGRQALDVIAAFPDKFQVVALAAGSNAAALAELAQRHRPQLIALGDPRAAPDLAERLNMPAHTILTGQAGLATVASHPDVDLVVAAIVGQAGLPPTYAAIAAGKRVALASKESLVMAGELIMRVARERTATILPIDSEHAGVHQTIAGITPEQIHSLILTASGGPLLGRGPEELRDVEAAEALAHPKWEMGAKITIDSATLMNKGFEVIEARWLFDLPPDRIRVVIHPESVVHAMVELTDGSVLAQLGIPDMRGPIAYALGFPERLDLPGRLSNFGRLDLAQLGCLTFREPDHRAFPALLLCRHALEVGGTLPAALAAADEAVIEAFLARRLRFHEIVEILSAVAETYKPHQPHTLEDVLEAGAEGRRLARTLITTWGHH
jgi:1-deoxy-D-xylulose-5-phosphate reductoisomerase